MRAEGEVEEAYPEEELNIRVTVTRDEDSEGEELKRENEELRERRSYGAGRSCPSWTS